MNYPDEPSVPESERASAPVALRYEDVSQDGRLLLEMMPTALGEVAWKRLFVDHPLMRAARRTGVIPILSRVVIEGGEGPISVTAPIEGHGSYQLSHTLGADGAVDRILLGMWCRLTGQVGRLHGPRPSDTGRVITVGRVFAEHVLTRPFAAPDERKVLRIEAEGLPDVPPVRSAWVAPASLLTLPDGAVADGTSLEVDPMPIVLGLDHTDSNQHVNSLVYPRLFVEATLRRLSDLGRPTRLLARSLEIAYRKPSFAGDRLAIALRTFTLGGAPGAVLALVTRDEAKGDLSRAKPRCFARMLFSE